MVLTNAELTNILNGTLSLLITEFVEVAFGSGTATEAPTDTALGNELLQQARQEYTSLADRVVLSGYLGPGQLNGDSITEIGWKTGASATLLQRKVITAFSKTSAKEFWTDLTIIPTVTQL